jgi:hypothetical protein
MGIGFASILYGVFRGCCEWECYFGVKLLLPYYRHLRTSDEGIRGLIQLALKYENQEIHGYLLKWLNTEEIEIAILKSLNQQMDPVVAFTLIYYTPPRFDLSNGGRNQFLRVAQLRQNDRICFALLSDPNVRAGKFVNPKWIGFYREKMEQIKLVLERYTPVADEIIQFLI